MNEKVPPLSEAVRSQMKRMPRRNTRPEMELRRELHRRGLRFRVALHGLPGTPDLAFTRARLAVFVDGCFWHLCPEHCVLPRNNADWWKAKLYATQERDKRKDAELVALDWLPVHVWEHENPIEAADRVETIWRSRVQTAWSPRTEPTR